MVAIHLPKFISAHYGLGRERLKSLTKFALAGAGIGWCGFKLRQAWDQRKAVEAIQSVGGVVIYDYQEWLGRFDPLAKPLAPAWLRKTLGDDLFANVLDVNFYGSSVTNAELLFLRWLPRLQFLFLQQTAITDAGLAALHDLAHLRCLDLGYTHITDNGLPHLYRLSQLRCIHLSGTQVTDVGTDQLKALLPHVEVIR